MESREDFQAEISLSIDVKVEGLPIPALKNPLAGLNVNVYGSASIELQGTYSTESSKYTKSKFFQSKGVHRFAQIGLRDDYFRNRHQYTLDRDFVSHIKFYLDSTFDKRLALEILNTYGMFIADNILVGGYWKHTSAMSETNYKKLTEYSVGGKACLKLGIQAKQGGLFNDIGLDSLNPFPEGEVEVKGCFGGSYAKADAILNKAVSETKTGMYKGCNKGGEITGNTVVPLPLNMYPAGNSIVYRPLYAFLNPDKINPHFFQMITPDQFKDIQKNLLEFMEEYFSDAAKLMKTGGCLNCKMPYLTKDKGSFVCKCHREVSEPLQDVNTPCEFNFQCKVPNCKNGLCELKEVGSLCKYNNECKTETCIYGYCCTSISPYICY